MILSLREISEYIGLFFGFGRSHLSIGGVASTWRTICLFLEERGTPLYSFEDMRGAGEFEAEEYA